MITTTIDKDSIVRTLQMEVVWEPWIIIDKRSLFSLLFISDVDLADGTGRLTNMLQAAYIYISSRFIRRGVYHYIAVSGVLSQFFDTCCRAGADF